MWRLTIEDDEGKRTPLPLFRDEYTVGRSEENTIRLTERNISRRHAVLRRAASNWVLVDFRSYNGSYVNGVRVSGEARLEHGDVVQLGDYRIEVANEAMLEPTTGAGSDAGVGAAKPDRLVVVAGPVPGQEFAIVAPTMLLGRAAEVDVSIPHISVSRVHAEIHALGGGRYEIIDKGSANGVRVNGSQLGRALIEAGDYIELGEVRLKFVGAGQVFWPGAEATRLAPEPLESSTGRPPSLLTSSKPAAARKPERRNRHRGSMFKNVAIGAVGAAAAVGGTFAYQHYNAVPPRGLPMRVESIAPKPGPDPGRAAVEEAKRLANEGRVELAHATLAAALPSGVPSTSALRDSAEVHEIEGRWADAIFAKAEQEPEPSTRRTLLNSVAQSTTVDSERRKLALEKLRDFDERGTEPRDLPQASSRPSPSSRSSQPSRTGEPAPSRPQRTAVLAPDPWASPPSSGTSAPSSSGRATPAPPREAKQ